MKKLLAIMMIAITVFLVGCQTLTTTAQATTETPTTMGPTTLEPTTLVPTTVVPTTVAPTTDPTTTTAVYDDRSLVPESCQFLDNIDDWQPVWCDEFDVDGLVDSTKWTYDVGGGGWGNQELQYYTEADLDNARVSDGNLYITALKETVGSNSYTSARLVSKYRGDWQYGRIQIRAKMPSGRGLWTALWMLPTDWRYGGWPDSGEIDIMEYVGYDDDRIFGTIHTGAYNHSLGTQIGFNKVITGAETEFHLYEMIWEPGKIDLYIDGFKFAYFGYNPNSNIDIANSDAWPFDQRFHLIMNIAVGGTWGGSQGVDDTIFPQSMVVDYVRVYQKDYEGMDQENPSSISGLTVQKTTNSSIQIKWNHATDDVAVKQYDVFFNCILKATTTVNGLLVTGLNPDTNYNIDVITVDFANNRSENVSLSVTTLPVPSVLSVIQAEFYTDMSGVRLEDTTDVGGGKNVGWIDNNDYMTYLLRVEEAGTYTITYRVASESGGGEIRLSYAFVNLGNTLIPATGGWQVWTDVTSQEFNLQPGVYTFTVRAVSGGFNLNYFSFEKVN
ncbi:MAG: family 16 glycosylhydrolase [Candidatus Izemoplasmatales bacterium]|nr:family 16 glycosylhydrolase [Candidatus Izemoplasmatales bacterium]